MSIELEPLLESYLQQMHRLSLSIASQEATEEERIALLDQKLTEATQDPMARGIFQAEKLFYTHHYEEALRLYLQFKNSPLHPFFCYRASAFLSAKMGHHEKALDYAKRALAIQHNDLHTLHLCKELSLREELPFEESQEAGLTQQELEESLAHFMEENDEQIPQETTNALSRRTEIFREAQRRFLADYLNRSQRAERNTEELFCVLNGWNKLPESPYLLESTQPAEGGYYLRWRGFGIAINPGKGFLHHFHMQGLHLHDIDCVIVTSHDSQSYVDIRALYTLNGQLNRYREDLHIIHYYLNRHAYQEIARDLKPNFKQEAGSVHSLELYVDSPESESLSLSDAINLYYFLATGDQHSSQLGIRLELLSDQEETSSINIGYLSKTPWKPTLAPHLMTCHLLILGIENSPPPDYKKIQYNEDSLGYLGALTLTEEIKPHLVLCCEFGGAEGDIRLELVQKMRQDCSNSATTILPGDIGLKLDLTHFTVNCGVTGLPVDLTALRVIKSQEAFGKLHYLSPDCVI